MDQPARSGRDRLDGSSHNVGHRAAVPVARAARRAGRLAQRPADHGHPRARCTATSRSSSCRCSSRSTASTARHIDAARDLGASPASAFFRVTLPLSMPGILAGAVLIALPMFGDYYTADLVSASTQTNMIGQPDRRVHATGVSEGDRRRADAAPVDVPAGADVLLPAHNPPGGHDRPDDMSRLRNPWGTAALPRADHRRLHRLGAAPGAARDRVRVQRRALAHDLAGILDSLVHGRNRQRAARPVRCGTRSSTRCCWP